MAVVVDKLLTIMGFKIEAKDLEKYRSTGKKAQREVGEGLRRAGRQAAGGLGSTSLAAGAAGGAVGALVVAAQQLTSTLTGVLTGALQGIWNWLGKVRGAVEQFTVNVFTANAEFERLRTLMTSLLGSETAADKMLARFEKFAAKTPFQLNEIADLFLNIKGLGADLGQDGLKAIGDLAASAGVSLHDFSEIFKSAAQGNAAMVDRLAKAGGIRAVSEKGKLRLFGPGDKKGKLIDPKDTQALLDFFIAAGKMKGIEGGMAKLSVTLGGLLSTLRDNAAAFLRQVGKGGFNDAVKRLFTDLSGSAPRADKLGLSIGRLMGKVIGFGRKTFKALNLDYIFGLVDSIFAKVTSGFDKLTGKDGPAKLARAIELPFKLLESFILILEGKGRDSPLARWFAQFDDGDGAIGRAARSFNEILDLIDEVIRKGDDGKSVFDEMLSFAKNEGARALVFALEIIRLIIKHREGIAELATTLLRTLNLLGELLSLLMGLTFSEVDGELTLAGLIVDLEKANALLASMNQAVKELPGHLKELETGAFKGLSKFLGFASLANPLDALAGGAFDVTGLDRLAANRVAGAPGGGGGGATNNTTTNSTNNTTTITTGPITVKSPSELSGVLGGLAGAARAAGGG